MISDAHSDAMLDEYQEREYERALEREARGDIEARRPTAERQTVTFGDLVVGDFMTAESGPEARWVKVVDVNAFKPRKPGQVTVTFQTPQPIGVGMEDRWVIDRDPAAEVVIDASARDALREGRSGS